MLSACLLQVWQHTQVPWVGWIHPGGAAKAEGHLPGTRGLGHWRLTLLPTKNAIISNFMFSECCIPLLMFFSCTNQVTVTGSGNTRAIRKFLAVHVRIYKAQRREGEVLCIKTTHVKTWSYCSSARTYEMEVSSRRRTSVDRRSGRGSLGAGFESLIHLLHHELYVASIPKQSLSRVSHSLLQVLLGLFDRDPKGRQ